MPTPNDIPIGDQIKHMLAADMQKRMGTDMPPMIGAFTLIAEYTDPETGELSYLSFSDMNIPAWTEIGLLEARLATCKQEWVKMGMQRYEENGEGGG